MSLPNLPRVLLTLLPAALLAAMGASAVWGDSGLLARHDLARRLEEANADLAALERENQRLVRELVVLEHDPLAVERQVAQELGWARPGSTVYRFEPPGSRGARRPAGSDRPEGRSAVPGPAGGRPAAGDSDGGSPGPR